MKQNFTMPFTESGITLDFPDANYFCFENCKGYKQLSGNHFKEMDACWFDSENKYLYLIELKDFTQANISESTDNMDKRVWDLVKKSIDSCLMLNAILIQTNPATDLQNCMPQVFDRTYSIKLFHIIHSTAEQKGGIQFLSDSFKKKFLPYKALFGIENSSVVTYEQAKRFLDWVI